MPISESRKRAVLISAVPPAAIVALCCGILHAYSGGPDPRYSGAPGDNPGSCTFCHKGQALNAGPGDVKILLMSGNFYTPGVTQHISVQVTDPQQRRWGFQMSARLKSNQMNGQAGDFNPTDAFTQVICANQNPKPCSADALVQFIEHTTTGTRPGVAGAATFEFDWTPPQTDSGNVVLYVAANAANGDSTQLGDHIYTASAELAPASGGAPQPVSTYAVHNLVSDIPGLADQADSNLTNPWGIALNTNGPFWISNNRSGMSTVYDGSGQPFPAGQGLVVNTPGGAPTGAVFNGTPGFEIASGSPALFIFGSERGIISGWNPAVDPGNAKQMIDNSGSSAVYKGLAVGANASGQLLYAANFRAGTIDVFDAQYRPVAAAGGFTDPNLPAGFAPFNIRKIGRRLYVTYALQNGEKHDAVSGAGNGFINAFDMDGNLLQRLVSNGMLNAPWGITLAPGFFGDYSNTLLVANSGDGSINAFDPFTGDYIGTLKDAGGNSINVSGLWALQFGNGHNGGDANTLYFTAGIANGGSVGDHGLFGAIQTTQ